MQHNGRALIYSWFSVRMFVLDLQPLYCENIAFSGDLITLVNNFENSFHSQNICIYLWIYDEYLHPFKCQNDCFISKSSCFFFAGVFVRFARICLCGLYEWSLILFSYAHLVFLLHTPSSNRSHVKIMR